MRIACLLLMMLLTLAAPAALTAQTTTRFGIVADTKTYPQATAKEALASVLKAIDDKKFDYLVAQLANPTFVDDRVKRIYAGKFSEQVADTKARLDVATVNLLKKFLADGKWTIDKTSALVQLDDIKDHVVRLVHIDGKWFLAHRFDPPTKD